MVSLDIHYNICFECILFQPFLSHIVLALHYLSKDLVRDDSSSSTIALHRHLPYGPGDNHKHDCIRLCSRMGAWGYLSSKCEVHQNVMQAKILTAQGMGIVVGGRCDRCLHLLLSPLCDVSTREVSSHSYLHKKIFGRLIHFNIVCISTRPSSGQ